MHKPRRKNGSLGKKIKLWLTSKDESEFSQHKLTQALNKIVEKLKINNRYDVPYIAGYSKDAKTIYIDKHVPKFMVYKNKKVNIQRFLVLHEIVEKALIDHLGRIHYELAHQIATRAELAAVQGEKISWNFYNNFIKKYWKEIQSEKIYHIPKNLDLKPYHDEEDTSVLKRMKKSKNKS